jgi:hypothetical protein
MAYHYGERGRLDVRVDAGRYVVSVRLPRGGGAA